MKRIGSDIKAASDMIPLFVLVGAIAVVIIGVVFANFFFFTAGDQTEDNGRFLDDDVVDRGEPFAFFEVSGYGTIKVALDQNKAPIAVANFIELCEKNFYNGLTFHRVIPQFMIQGGDPSGDGTGGPGYTIEGEANNGLTHAKGALACAKRSGETRMSGSQFYIVQADNGATHLDGEHTVFGMTVEGIEIVDRIANAQTGSNDNPLNPIIMTKVYVEYE